MKTVVSSQNYFAALKYNGSVAFWGPPWEMYTYQNVASELASDVISVHSTAYNGFAALKKGGKVITWGASFYGGQKNYLL